METVVQVVIRIISTYVFYRLFTGIVALATKKEKVEHGTVILPKGMLVIGIIGTAIFAGIEIAYLLTAEEYSVWESAVFISLAALGCSLIIGYKNCRITYNETEFVQRNFLGIRKTYRYEQITGRSGSKHDCYLYVGKHKIKVDWMASGGSEFVAHAAKKYRTVHNGNTIPEVPKKKDIFNGNVERPGEFLFVYILIALIPIALCILGLIIYQPKQPDDLEYKEVACTQWKVEESDLYIYSAASELPFIVRSYQTQVPEHETLLGIVKNGDLLTIGYTACESADTPYNRVEYIMDENQYVLLSMEQSQEYLAGDLRLLLLMAGIMEVVWLLFCAFNIYVGRNPKKFSKRVKSLFFKDGYLRE